MGNESRWHTFDNFPMRYKRLNADKCFLIDSEQNCWIKRIDFKVRCHLRKYKKNRQHRRSCHKRAWFSQDDLRLFLLTFYGRKLCCARRLITEAPLCPILADKALRFVCFWLALVNCRFDVKGCGSWVGLQWLEVSSACKLTNWMDKYLWNKLVSLVCWNNYSNN